METRWKRHGVARAPVSAPCSRSGWTASRRARGRGHYAKGWRLLRLPSPRRCLLRQGPATRVGSADRPTARVPFRRASACRPGRSRDRSGHRRTGQGIRRRVRPRGLRVARDRSDHPSQADRLREARRPPCSDLRARQLDIRGSRLQGEGVEVALPDWRVRTEVPLAEGVSDAPADPARDAALALALQGPRLSGAGVRAAQERVRLGTPSRSRHRASCAPR
jgi:hypothetical protein